MKEPPRLTLINTDQEGTPSATSAEADRVAAMLIEGMAGDFSKWLDRVGETDPAKACEIYVELLRVAVVQGLDWDALMSRLSMG